MPRRSLTTIFVITLTLSSALAGCGRRGELEPPSSTVAPAGTVSQNSSKAEKSAKKTVPDRHFILDPLIQ